MTKFQALFVLWLRHEEFCGGSWRWIAQKYNNRYVDKIPFNTNPTTGGNQIDGINLEIEAFEVLLKDVDPIIVGMDYDLYECDLIYVNANLKNHYE